jgi:hypothetical protein
VQGVEDKSFKIFFHPQMLHKGRINKFQMFSAGKLQRKTIYREGAKDARKADLSEPQLDVPKWYFKLSNSSFVSCTMKSGGNRSIFLLTARTSACVSTP